jgi:tetratricopeptide (TPR) repeat protein
LLELRGGQAARAEADLTILLRDDPEEAAEIFAWRALARLVLGRPPDAEADAANAFRRRPSPSRERLWIRTLLALGRVEDLLWLKSPDDLAVLPGGGPSLRADLRAAADRLGTWSQGPVATATLAHRTRAVLLGALGDPAAEAEASRAIELAPGSDDAYLVRARVRRRRGDLAGALADVEMGLNLEPGDPRLLTLQGLLESETGHPGTALALLNQAVVRGGLGMVHAPRALALSALGRDEKAVEEWSLALADDPEDPRLYLGRARALLRRRLWDRALADLEQAAEWAGENPGLLARITLDYAACLPGRPARFPRWLAHARHARSAWTASALDGRYR